MRSSVAVAGLLQGFTLCIQIRSSEYLACKQLSFELFLSFVFLIISKLCPILSGVNDAISPRELPLIGYFLFLGDGCGEILVDQPVWYQQPSHSQSH